LMALKLPTGRLLRSFIPAGLQISSCVICVNSGVTAGHSGKGGLATCVDTRPAQRSSTISHTKC
jgi:hypothetical protein